MWMTRLPRNPFDELRREMERVFDDCGLGLLRPPLAARAFPALNIWDAGDAVCVEAELPGVNRDELEVYAMGNELTIKGRRAPQSHDKATYHRRERVLGEFTRIVTLPVEVNPEQIEAVLKDGVLTVRMPKAERARPRKIALHAN